MKNITDNTICPVQELHFFHNHVELNYKPFYLRATLFNVIFSHQYFQYILQLIYQLNFFHAYNFNNLNILQRHMIYHIHIYNYLDSK